MAAIGGPAATFGSRMTETESYSDLISKRKATAIWLLSEPIRTPTLSNFTKQGPRAVRGASGSYRAKSRRFRSRLSKPLKAGAFEATPRTELTGSRRSRETTGNRSLLSRPMSALVTTWSAGTRKLLRGQVEPLPEGLWTRSGTVHGRAVSVYWNQGNYDHGAWFGPRFFYGLGVRARPLLKSTFQGNIERISS